MSVSSERANPLVIKLGALFAIIVGFLMTAQGYRSGSTGLVLVGIVALGIGLALFALNIKRRNEGA